MLDRNFVFSLSQDTLIHSQFVQPIRTSLSVDPHQNISTNSEIDGQVTIKINDQFEACIVCLEREQNCVLLECGHSGICVECAQRLRAQAGRCPLCRGGIASMVRIVRRGPTQVRARGALRLRAGAALLTPPSPHDFQCRKHKKQCRATNKRLARPCAPLASAHRSLEDRFTRRCGPPGCRGAGAWPRRTRRSYGTRRRSRSRRFSSHAAGANDAGANDCGGRPGPSEYFRSL